MLVTDVYRRRCAVTGERTLPVLEAAHVRPYAEGGRHELTNGILLRSDLHTVFDRGYVTVTPDYRLEVSRRIRDEFENGRDYYALHGREVRVPAGPDVGQASSRGPSRRGTERVHGANGLQSAPRRRAGSHTSRVAVAD